METVSAILLIVCGLWTAISMPIISGYRSRIEAQRRLLDQYKDIIQRQGKVINDTKKSL